MAPKKATTDGSDTPVGLTDGELRFIKAVFDNMTQKPDADWSSVATDLGLKDAKCAKERFRQMSVRHGWRGDGGNTSGGAGSPRKSKSGAAANGDSKVTKKKATSRKRSKKDENEDAKDGVKADDNVKMEAGDDTNMEA